MGRNITFVSQISLRIKLEFFTIILIVGAMNNIFHKLVTVDTTYHRSLLEHLAVPLDLLVHAPRRLSVLDELRARHGAGVVTELDLLVAVLVALFQPHVELSPDVRTLLLKINFMATLHFQQN